MNRLKNEKSPYLFQHRNNPVNWYPWVEEAFKKAADEDKPIFLSIGYSTCHWCHVMAHESFEDEQVAKLLNQNFVAIKVDREERPDVDSVYMSVCQALTGSGGWPLTVIMTAEQKPFFAGTYFPKTTRFGQMGLTELLGKIVHLWRMKREALLEDGDKITKFISNSEKTHCAEPEKNLFQKAFLSFNNRFDKEWGGFGRAPKFPSPHNLLFLMRYAQAENEPKALEMVETTLKAMAKGGMFDHIGGGFSRYSTDRKWLVPHFEKMLYDNALLIITYLKCYQITQNEFYADVVRRTADYVLRELTDSSGGFYCGQDADSEGVDGKYYVFTPDEVISVLGKKDGADFCMRYGIEKEGNFERGSIPNLIDTKQGWESDDIRLKQLYDYRKKRTVLHRDEKCLLSWNAWTIIALAEAGMILNEGRYLSAALNAQNFIETEMTAENDRLFLRYKDGEKAHFGQLEDYAVYSLALLTLYRSTFDAEFLNSAISRAEQMVRLFGDKGDNGYFINAFDAEQLIARPKEAYDGAVPSGNSVAAMVFEMLASLTGETVWRTRADSQHRFMAGKMEDYPSGYCFALLAMMKLLYPNKELICTGSTVPGEIIQYLRLHTADELNVLFKSKENAELISKIAPFTEAYSVPDSGTMWYLCENSVCKSPVSTFSELNL